MTTLIHPHEKVGMLQINGGIRSIEKELAIKAAVEDLPGVYATEARRDGIRLYYDPELVSEQQFYEAVKLGGFHASGFDLLGD